MELKNNIPVGDIFHAIPDVQEFGKFGDNSMGEANVHIHTPWSFSAFETIDQAFELAAEAGLSALGINDFITTAGYEAFMESALVHRIFPLFNIEFITLYAEAREKGWQVNDPDNPGRTYFCGKGLPWPFNPPADFTQFLRRLRNAENNRVFEMAERLNRHLDQVEPRIKISQDGLRALAKSLVRERHLARAVRMAVAGEYPAQEERHAAFTRIFSGTPPIAALTDDAALENEIRSRLLKKGGVAYLTEDSGTFPALSQVRDLLIRVGGIPCYPVLLDNPDGQCTPFERDPEVLAEELKALNIHAVEFIPSRNDATFLTRYVRFFREQGFLVMFGTEHNTPHLAPMNIQARHGRELPEDVRHTGWDSACIVAAHQVLVSRGEEGYLLPGGTLKHEERETFIRLGSGVIRWFKTIKPDNDGS